MASVVETLDGQELRIYDLRSGEYVVWMRAIEIRQPVWSPGGDRLVASTRDSVFVGAPDAANPPALLFAPRSGMFEGFDWLPDDRLIGTHWAAAYQMKAAHVDQRPVVLDTLVPFAAFGRPSPDGRWIAYNSPDFEELWVEPFPRTGRRYRVGAGYEGVVWLSPSAFVSLSWPAPVGFDRITMDASVDPPAITRRRWFDTPRVGGFAGMVYSLTPDGRVVYKQGPNIAPARYLRVIPNWVALMKRAVDEANK